MEYLLIVLVFVAEPAPLDARPGSWKWTFVSQSSQEFVTLAACQQAAAFLSGGMLQQQGNHAVVQCVTKGAAATPPTSPTQAFPTEKPSFNAQ